jgi:hypothetical protein
MVATPLPPGSVADKATLTEAVKFPLQEPPLQEMVVVGGVTSKLIACVLVASTFPAVSHDLKLTVVL